MKRQRLYGLTGLLSLLGFIGVFSAERAFLAFFAFAVDFEYFFIPSDEMAEACANRAAALGFHFGMLATAVAGLLGFFAGGQTPREALLTGFSVGWACAAAVHALATAWFGIRERWGLSSDSESD